MALVDCHVSHCDTDLYASHCPGLTLTRVTCDTFVWGGVQLTDAGDVTIAGNLKDMYKHIVAVGNDVLVQGSRQCGSVLVENMMVAGR